MQLLAAILILMLAQVNIELCTGKIQCFTDVIAVNNVESGTDCSTDQENCVSEVKYTGVGFKEKTYSHRCEVCTPTADAVGTYDSSLLKQTWTSKRCCNDNDCNNHDLNDEKLFPPGPTCFKCAAHFNKTHFNLVKNLHSTPLKLECVEGGEVESADYKKDTAVCDFNTHQCSVNVMWNETNNGYTVQRGCTKNCTDDQNWEEKIGENYTNYKYSKCCRTPLCNTNNLTVNYEDVLIKLNNTDNGNAVTRLVSTYTLLGLLSICYNYLR